MDFLQENVTFRTRVPSEWQLNWQDLSGENNLIKSQSVGGCENDQP